MTARLSGYNNFKRFPVDIGVRRRKLPHRHRSDRCGFPWPNFLAGVHSRALAGDHEWCKHQPRTEPRTFMAEGTNPGRHPRLKERRYRRFSLRYPVSVKFDLGNSVSELRAVSRNISIGGVLLEADSAIPQHCDVKFIMTVLGHHIIGPTQIIGEGEVVRVEPHGSGAGFAIAVKCKRPISELRGYLPTTAS